MAFGCCRKERLSKWWPPTSTGSGRGRSAGVEESSPSRTCSLSATTRFLPPSRANAAPVTVCECVCASDAAVCVAMPPPLLDSWQYLLVVPPLLLVVLQSSCCIASVWDWGRLIFEGLAVLYRVFYSSRKECPVDGGCPLFRGFLQGPQTLCANEPSRSCAAHRSLAPLERAKYC